MRRMKWSGPRSRAGRRSIGRTIANERARAWALDMRLLDGLEGAGVGRTLLAREFCRAVASREGGRP